MRNLKVIRSFWLFRHSIITAVVVAFAAMMMPAKAAFQELYAFPTTPQDANGSVAQGLDGNFYGTTLNGGLSGYGTVYKVTPAGVLTVLFSFANTNGANPNAGLVLAGDGNFYGTTTAGGSTGNGTIFRISSSGVFTSLYSFSGSDGVIPTAGLSLGSDGVLYGTASSGGVIGVGAVFSMTIGGTFNYIGSFDFDHGYNPNGGVILGSDGNFYGTTASGGDSGDGTVYVMSPSGGLTNVFSFDGASGTTPNAGLVEGAPGVFYGTTTGGGANGKGTIFAVNSSGAFTNLLSFNNTDGATPQAKLLRTVDGTLYGTTFYGGTNHGPLGDGTVFKMTAAGAFTSIFSFDLANGANPYGELILGNDGNLYGTTSSGKGGGDGTVFQMTTNGALTTLVSFTSGSGASPRAGLAAGNDGNYYGVTYAGGSNNYGAFFSITPAGVLTPLFSFGLTNGANPVGTLLLGSNGNFFGTTYNGGGNGLGTVFEITPLGSMVRSVSCTTNTGANPQAGLILAGDGNYYGTASQSGAHNFGTVFRMTPGGFITNIFAFDSSHGHFPAAGLVLDATGVLYGTTSAGGQFFFGTIFKITTNGLLTILASFDGSNGGSPQAGLILNGGIFYGTAPNGGDFNGGTLFSMTPLGAITVLNSLDGTGGVNPLAPLIPGSDGNFYGTTSSGGSGGSGTVFRMLPNGTVIPLLGFNGANGASPVAGLVQAPNGDLFGVASGGSLGNGNVFKVLSLSASDPPLITTQPANQTVNAGLTANFQVAAATITPLGYQWYRGAAALSNTGHFAGTTTDTLTITSVDDTFVDSYFVVLTNAAGGTTSSHVTLTVIDPPTVSSQPADVLTNIGATVNFQVTGTGGGLSYIWKRNGTQLSNTGNIAGATTASLTMTGVQPANAGTYTVFLNNSAGATNSNPAILSLYDPPSITIPPMSATNNVTETAVFSVTANSAIPMTFQWFKGASALSNSGHIAGATASTLSVVNVSDSDVASYSVVVSNASGAVTSSAATLTVIDIPSITGQPASVVTNAGATVTFHVIDTGPSSVYQWKHGITVLSNGAGVSGATNSTLTLTSVLAASAGSYTVQISNSAGATNSSPAVLTVTDPFIVTQPAARTNNETTAAIFNVTANGTSLTYQWRSNGIALANGGKISGALTSSLTVAAVVQANAANYSVTVTGASGPLLSSNALLTVIDIPTITTPPVSVATNAAATVNFQVVAASVGLSYQWRRNGTDLSNVGIIHGATNAILTLAGVLATNEGSYSVHVSNSAGSVDSVDATLTVTDPYIATQPLSRTNYETTDATFTVGATGTSLGYQWKSNGVALVDGGKISGALTSTLTVTAVVHNSAATYSVTVTGAKTPVTSAPAILSIIDIPTISLSPTSVATNAGATVNFQVAATSSGLGYHWRRNGTDLTDSGSISGATTTNLTLLGVIEANAGTYLAHVTNAAGGVDSAPATLTVNDPFIRTQPVSQTVNAGTVGILSVEAYGTSLIYQWRSNGIALTDGGSVSGSGQATLSITNLIRADSATYSVQVTGFSGPILSSPAVLTVLDPAINGQPLDAGVNFGQTNVFVVDAGGTPTLRYQWYFSNNVSHAVTKILGKTNATLTLGPIVSAMIGGYRVVVTNQLTAPNSVTSRLAKLFFNVAPTITTQPQDHTSVAVGATVTLKLTATGTPPLVYQWLSNSTPIVGAITNKLVMTNVQTTYSATYQCLVTNASGVPALTTNKHGIVLVTNIPPKITHQPTNYNFAVGNDAIFTVTATGTAPLAYQWAKDGVSIPGATTTILSFINVQQTGTHTYSCTVTNPAAIPATTLLTKGNLTVTNDTKPPVITYIYPNIGARLTNNVAYTLGTSSNIAPNFLLAGSITDNGLITDAFIQRTFPPGDPPIPANLTQTAPGKAKFTNLLTLVDGTNTYVIYAHDSATNMSVPKTRTFFMVNNSFALTVTNNGNGTNKPVSLELPNAPKQYPFGTPTNGAYLEIGRGYKIKALPGPNTIFTNWTDGNGLVLSTNLALNFIMTNQLTLNANFLTNPIIAAGVNGSFNGLFGELDTNLNPVVSERSSGMIGSLSVGTNRTFTGRIFLNGKSNSFGGAFDLTGKTEFVLSRAGSGLPSLDITLQLDWQLGTKTITGTISNMDVANPWIASVLADLAVYNTNNNPYAKVGRFTMVIPPAANAPENSPGGAGYATITNTAAGKSIFTGKLGDGTSISYTGPISKDGHVPFYQNIYSKQGLAIGWLTFACNCPDDTAPNPTPFPQGEIFWIRPASPPAINITSTTYQQGFTNVVTVLGSSYVPAAPALSSPVHSLDFTDGDGLGLPLHYDVVLGANNTLTKVPPSTNSLSAVITGSTGLLTATFHPPHFPMKTGTGVVLQNLNVGYGYFIASTNSLGATNSGLIYLH